VIALQFKSKCGARPLLRIAGYTDKLAQDPSTQRDFWLVFLVASKEFRHFAPELATRPLQEFGFWLRKGSRAAASPSFMNISRLRPYRRIIEEICTELQRSNGLLEWSNQMQGSNGVTSGRQLGA
jgi:hypothetical protein